MAKTLTEYVCQSCGHRAPKWLGKCPECEAWNTLAEEKVKVTSSKRKSGNSAVDVKSVQPVTAVKALTQNRLITGIGEFDRTLGGGLVEGSLTLIGGDPGIGKSTLLLQSMGEMAKSGAKVLYVSGEESPAQIKLRADRLGALSDNLLVCSEICIEEVLRVVDQVQPDALVLDSIQTFFTTDLQSAPGSIGQVREVAFKIFQDVKKRAMPALLIGHITKDGAIAGPKSLEHIVDTVIYFEGEKGHSYRILRAIKNRFGSTPEIGVFEMLPKGLVGVENPSDIFLSERPADSPILCKRRVDFPIPGSPPIRTRDPSTSPPPKVRSNSPIPVINLFCVRASTEVTGWTDLPSTAPLSAFRLERVAFTFSSARVFHPSHSGHLPNHFGARWPQL